MITTIENYQTIIYLSIYSVILCVVPILLLTTALIPDHLKTGAGPQNTTILGLFWSMYQS